MRETNGGPIPDARIRLGKWNKFVEVRSDEAGLFAFPAGAFECGTNSTGVSVVSNGFHIQESRGVNCTRLLDPPPVVLTVLGQRALLARVGATIETVLSNEDFDWVIPEDPNDFPCGPCRYVSLALPRGRTAQLRVEWSGPEPLRVWLSGDVRWEQTERIGEFERAPGERAIVITIPSEWQALHPFVKIGLPYGHRNPVGLAAPVAVRIELQVVQ